MEYIMNVIDRFLLLSYLGDGINSNVFLGKNLINKKLYAIKIFKYNKFFNTNLIKEIEIWSKMNHKNIIKLINFKDRGQFLLKESKDSCKSFIIFEYCKNGNIFDLISINGGFSEKISRKYFIDLINGLQYIHSIGYAHRNLKLKNILWNDRYDLKIIGFDDLKLLNIDELTNKLSIKARDTSCLTYEALKNQIYDEKKADIFSCGIILFILLLGRPPFIQASNKCIYFKLILNGKFEKFWDIHLKLINNEISVPETFKNLFNNMINPNIEKRFTIENIKNHEWINGKIANKNAIKLEIQKRKKLIWKNDNWKIHKFSENPIKPLFRSNNSNKEITLIKNLLIENNLSILKNEILIKKPEICIKILYSDLDSKKTLIILIKVLILLKSKILKFKDNCLISEFIINKELNINLAIQFSIYDFKKDSSKIIIQRISGNSQNEIEIINSIEDIFKIIK